MGYIDSFLKKVSPEKQKVENQKLLDDILEKIMDPDDTIGKSVCLSSAVRYLKHIISLGGVNCEMKNLLLECIEALSGCVIYMVGGLQLVQNKEYPVMIVERIQTQFDLYRVATVLNNVSDGCGDDQFVLLAKEVNEINTKMLDDLIELGKIDSSVMAKMEKINGC